MAASTPWMNLNPIVKLFLLLIILLGTSTARSFAAACGALPIPVRTKPLRPGLPGSRDARFRPDPALADFFAKRDYSTEGVLLRPDIKSIATQSDGRVLLLGQFPNLQFNGLVRLNTNGDIDPTFVKQSIVAYRVSKTNDFEFRPLLGSRFLVQADDKILLADATSIMRLNPDGSLDPSFKSALPVVVHQIGERFFTNQISALAPQSDGKILVGFNGPENTRKLVRLKNDGGLDEIFHVDDPLLTAAASVDAIFIQPNRGILVQLGDGSQPTGIYRLKDDGSVDQTFGDGSDPRGFGITMSERAFLLFQHGTTVGERLFLIAVQADGKLILGATLRGQTALERRDGAGSPDMSFAPVIASNPGACSVPVVAVERNGRILIAGHFSSVNGAERIGAARLNSDGSPDPSFDLGGGLIGVPLIFFGPDFEGELQGYPMWMADRPEWTRERLIAFDRDGNVLITGSFNFVNGVGPGYLVRLYGGAWTQNQPPDIVMADLRRAVDSPGVEFQVFEPATSATVIIEAATSLLPPNWTAIATNKLSTGHMTIYDEEPFWLPAKLPQRFYRARTIP